MAASFIPLRTDPYRPGCSTVAVNPFEQPPLADIITDDKVLQSLHELHIPYLCDLVFSGLHRIAFPAVSEWYQYPPRIRVTLLSTRARSALTRRPPASTPGREGRDTLRRDHAPRLPVQGGQLRPLPSAVTPQHGQRR